MSNQEPASWPMYESGAAIRAAIIVGVAPKEVYVVEEAFGPRVAFTPDLGVGAAQAGDYAVVYPDGTRAVVAKLVFEANYKAVEVAPAEPAEPGSSVSAPSEEHPSEDHPS